MKKHERTFLYINKILADLRAYGRVKNIYVKHSYVEVEFSDHESLLKAVDLWEAALMCKPEIISNSIRVYERHCPTLS